MINYPAVFGLLALFAGLAAYTTHSEELALVALTCVAAAFSHYMRDKEASDPHNQGRKS